MENAMKGKISVIMGIYNCEKTLPDAIESILAQSYTEWELIMCDDCSSDNTYQIAKYYADKYPGKIVLIQNEANMRLAYSLNHCLEYATGEYIARMDGDDFCDPDRFRQQVAFLKTNSEYDLVGTWMKRFNENGFGDEVCVPEYPDKYSLKNRSPFCHATILTYKYVYDAVGGYTVAERTKRAQDYDLWFKFYDKGFNGYNIPQSLYYVRENENAVKRRTFKVRWNAFKTTVYGYKLLNYPQYWLIKPFLMVFAKSIVPTSLIMKYREYQKKEYERNRG